MEGLGTNSSNKSQLSQQKKMLPRPSKNVYRILTDGYPEAAILVIIVATVTLTVLQFFPDSLHRICVPFAKVESPGL